MGRSLAALVVLSDVTAICKLKSATDPSCKMAYPQYRIHLKVNLPSSWGIIRNTGYYVNGVSILSEGKLKFRLQCTFIIQNALLGQHKR